MLHLVLNTLTMDLREDNSSRSLIRLFAKGGRQLQIALLFIQPERAKQRRSKRRVLTCWVAALVSITQRPSTYATKENPILELGDLGIN